MKIFKWTKGGGDYISETCLGVALNLGNASNIEIDECARIVKVLFPDRTGYTRFTGLFTRFNDHPNTTLEDVNRVCELVNLPFRFN